jgi:ribosomal protein S18 acetylase RimI-like enzyme
MPASPTDNALKIREAIPADAAIIAQFNIAMARETENRELDPARIIPGVQGLLAQRSRGVYYVAESQGRVVGQLLITYEWSDWRNGDFWWIQSVYVAADFRGQGVFKSLYRHVEALAKARADVCGLRLYVEAENHGAQQTYRRLGMAKTHYELFEVDFTQSPKH